MIVSKKLEKYILDNINQKIDNLILYNFYHTPKYKSTFQKNENENEYVLKNTGVFFDLKKNSKVSELLQEYCLNPQYLEEINGYQNIYHKITVNVLEWIFYNIYKDIQSDGQALSDEQIAQIKEYLHDIKFKVIEAIEKKENDNLYNLVENNLSILTQDFLFQSFDFLHLVFQEHREKQKFSKLINNFMKLTSIKDLTYLTTSNKLLHNQLNNFVKNLSIDDILILDKYYPKKEDTSELFWINKELLEEKIKINKSVDNIFTKFLEAGGVIDENEDMIFKIIVPLITSIYQIPGKKEVVISVESVYNKFVLDSYNRVISKDTYNHISLIDSLFHALKTNGSILITQHINSSKVLFGAIIHEKNYCGLSKTQLIQACEENSIKDDSYTYKDWGIYSDIDFMQMIRSQDKID